MSVGLTTAQYEMSCAIAIFVLLVIAGMMLVAILIEVGYRLYKKLSKKLNKLCLI